MKSRNRASQCYAGREARGERKGINRFKDLFFTLSALNSGAQRRVAHAGLWSGTALQFILLALLACFARVHSKLNFTFSVLSVSSVVDS